MALPRLFKRSEEIDPPGVTPAWLVRSVNAIAWLFVAILVMTVFLRSLDIARDKAVPLEVTHAGTWVGQLAFFFPLFAPLVLAAIALPWTAKVIIPAFCTFDWKDKRQRAPKVWCGVIAVCVAIVTMTSGFPLYHGAFNERFKQEAVKLEQVDQSRAKLQADLAAIEADLKDITNPALTTYQAQASREGAAAWAKRVAIAKAQNDYQADAIERALASAERGDQLRKQRSEAIKALAMAPTKAAALEQVKGAESYGSDKLVDFINAWWGFALFIVIELCALIAGWIAYMMMMLRTRQLADWEAVHNAPVPEAGIDLRITDGTDQWQPVPQETTYDPDTGDELIPVRRRKEVHYRRKPKKKDDAQAPLNASDPRAPVANQVELGDESTSPEPLPPSWKEPPSADAGGDFTDPTAGETDTSEGLDLDRRGGEFDAGAMELDQGRDLKATRTAYESSFEGQGQDEVDEGRGPILDSLSGSDDPADADGLDAGFIASETALNAPLETPDEPITWDDESQPSEPQEPEYHDQETAETHLPNGEGVLVRAAE